MPSRWVHSVINLIAYGSPYLDLHKKKDKAHEILGSNHRVVDHEWYQAYGRFWNFDDPFPSWLKESIRLSGNRGGAEKAEEQMAWVDHDYIDKIWDYLSPQEEKYREGFFAWILFNRRILKEWAGLDVVHSKIQRSIDGCEAWEYCVELKVEYERLCNYVSAVKRKYKALQNMIERYGHGQYSLDFG